MQTTIYLSSRGWGDYSPVKWTGDITRPDNEIIAECKDLLGNAHDVDQPNISDKAIAAMIANARADEQAQLEDDAMLTSKIAHPRPGHNVPCRRCGTYCYGDCSDADDS